MAYTTRFIGTPKSMDLSSERVRDEDGNEVRTTSVYSEEIGQVLYETQNLELAYAFTGDELYVRAVVTSDVDHPNPTDDGDVERVWTQPVAVGRL